MTSTATPAPTRLPRPQRPRTNIDVIGRRKWWYLLSGALIVLSLAGIGMRGLNLGVEFRGGAEFVVPGAACTLDTVTAAATEAGAPEPTVTTLGSDRIRVQTATLSDSQGAAVTEKVAAACSVDASAVKVQLVGPSWGSEITGKALTALAVFLVAVSVFLTIYFQWRYAVAALLALVHDLVITVGIYALSGFEVTPATVVGLLTILGFSLYDTVVVFDKVKENTAGLLNQKKLTFSDAANKAVNETFVRSINTSVVALLPVAAILFVGAGILGAGTLKDLALALLVGTAAGAYSSLFIAAPLLCDISERSAPMRELRERVTAARAQQNLGASTPSSVGAGPQMAEVTNKKRDAGTATSTPSSVNDAAGATAEPTVVPAVGSAKAYAATKGKPTPRVSATSKKSRARRHRKGGRI